MVVYGAVSSVLIAAWLTRSWRVCPRVLVCDGDGSESQIVAFSSVMASSNKVLITSGTNRDEKSGAPAQQSCTVMRFWQGVLLNSLRFLWRLPRYWS